MKQAAAANPNICHACDTDAGTLEEVIEEEPPSGSEPRMRGSDELHPSRRRSPATGDHSHERKTFPTLPRRKH